MKNSLIFILFLVSYGLFSQTNYPPKNVGYAIEYVYKKTKDTDLKVWVFNPKDHVLTKKKTCDNLLFWRRIYIWDT
jgi:hypothetical protein